MKYNALKAFLAARHKPRLRMTFEEVAKVAGTPLPASAYRYPAWWANDPTHHAQARAWTEAGYRSANVDLEKQRVEFVRVEAPTRGVQEMQKTYDHKPAAPVKKHPAAGALKGTFTVGPDWDLTQPALDPEELAEWEANIERMADEVYSRRTDKQPLRAECREEREMQQEGFERPSGPPVKKHPAAGLLKGTFTIRDWDVTQPALDADEYSEWEANVLRKMDEIKKGPRGKQ